MDLSNTTPIVCALLSVTTTLVATPEEECQAAMNKTAAKR
jgi:hypothetical protein